MDLVEGWFAPPESALGLTGAALAPGSSDQLPLCESGIQKPWLGGRAGEWRPAVPVLEVKPAAVPGEARN